MGARTPNDTAGTQEKRTRLGGRSHRDPRRIRGSQAISGRDFYRDRERARSARNVGNEGCAGPEVDAHESQNLGRTGRQSFLHGKRTRRAGTSGYRISKTGAGILADQLSTFGLETLLNKKRQLSLPPYYANCLGQRGTARVGRGFNLRILAILRLGIAFTRCEKQI
jgi:hypothetical protein